MRRLVIGAALAAAAFPAAAQHPRVPLMMSASEPSPCSTATIMNLAPGDEVSVRGGPSRRQPELGRLSNGAAVYACGRRGNWFAIVYETPDRRSGCEVLERWREAGPYRGPCRSGWVHSDYIGGYADWISP